MVAAASGRVLEVGIGSGLNFPLYGRQVETVVGIDPSPRLLAIARRRADAAGFRAELLQGSATEIPLADSTIDTVVMTWTLCSIADPLAALREMRRVLKPHGKLLFVEHGLSPEPRVERWQHRLTPIWCHVAGGCHLDGRWTTLSALPASIWPISERNTQAGLVQWLTCISDAPVVIESIQGPSNQGSRERDNSFPRLGQ